MAFKVWMTKLPRAKLWAGTQVISYTAQKPAYKNMSMVKYLRSSEMKQFDRLSKDPLKFVRGALCKQYSSGFTPTSGAGVLIDTVHLQLSSISIRTHASSAKSFLAVSHPWTFQAQVAELQRSNGH